MNLFGEFFEIFDVIEMFEYWKLVVDVLRFN